MAEFKRFKIYVKFFVLQRIIKTLKLHTFIAMCG